MRASDSSASSVTRAGLNAHVYVEVSQLSRCEELSSPPSVCRQGHEAWVTGRLRRRDGPWVPGKVGECPGTCDKWLYLHDRLEGRPFPLCCYSQTGPCSWEVHGRGVQLRLLPCRGGEHCSQGTASLSFRCWSVLTGLSLPLTEGRSEFTPGQRPHQA